MHNEKMTIFIDGSSGTAGLRIYDRLAQRADIDLLTLPPELHHDIEAQRELLNRADIAFLCLPDAAAITAADLVENPDTVVLDTSTAHRTAPGWTYGFLSAAAMSGKDSMVVSVSGNEERILLTSVFDNLGKGASGAALECLNLVMGKEKGFGLDL